jgi:hypothetical protein
MTPHSAFVMYSRGALGSVQRLGSCALRMNGGGVILSEARYLLLERVRLVGVSN